MEVVERIEERQDVREEGRRDLLERHRGIRSEERAVERDERGVVVDGVHGADQRAEPVEDHDDAGDDVVIEEDLKSAWKGSGWRARRMAISAGTAATTIILRRTLRSSSAWKRTSPATRSSPAKTCVRTSTGFQRTGAF